MENRKLGIIIASVAVVLFVVVAFIFMYEPARNVFTKPPVVEQEEITGDLPVLECDYENNQEVYKDAITKKDVNLCECVTEEKLKNICKGATMDVAFYDRALLQLDEELCGKINDDIQKDACYKVVQSSIEQFEEVDPQYLASLYSVTHNEKVIEEYEELIKSDEENIDNHISLAGAYAEKGLKEQEKGNDHMPYVHKAFEAIEKAKSIDEKKSEVYRMEAYVHEIQPDYNKAIIAYSKALELDENNIFAYAGRGHVNRMLGALDNSVEDFYRAAELDTDRKNVFIYTNLCNLEYSRAHNEDAIKNCKTVTQISSADPIFKSEAYQIMATIFIDDGDLTQAKNYLLQAKTITPNDPNLYVSLSSLNLFEQNFIQAAINANRAIKLSPTKSSSYLALANALYMQDKYQQSIEKAQKGLILIDDDVSLLTPSKPAMQRDLYYVIANNYRNLNNEAKQKEYEQKGSDILTNSNSSVTAQ